MSSSLLRPQGHQSFRTDVTAVGAGAVRAPPGCATQAPGAPARTPLTLESRSPPRRSGAEMLEDLPKPQLLRVNPRWCCRQGGGARALRRDG